MLAGLYAHARLNSGRVWLMFWCATYYISNMAARYLGVRHINNHFLTYIFICVQGPAILWAISHFQAKPVARLTLRLVIPPFLLAWLILTVLVEDTSNFSPIAEPIYSMLALGAALYTLVTRSAQESEPLMKQDWFWICAGLSLHFAALTVMTPFAAAYVKNNPDMVIQALEVRAGINVLAFSIMTLGMLCPRQARPGLSFSPRSSV